MLPLLNTQVQKTKEQYNNQDITAQNLVTELHVIQQWSLQILSYHIYIVRVQQCMPYHVKAQFKAPP